MRTATTQHYLQAVYETDQEQEKDERGVWRRGGTPRPASEWRWMEYGTFYGIHSPLKMKIFLRKLHDEGTGSTFEALERCGLLTCKYTWKRKNGEQVEERLLMVQITKEGRKLVRSAISARAQKPWPVGALREGHWRALAEAWKSGPEVVKASGGWYGDDAHNGWNTWLRLKQDKALIEEYQTWGEYIAHTGYTTQIYWLRLTKRGNSTIATIGNATTRCIRMWMHLNPRRAKKVSK